MVSLLILRAIRDLLSKVPIAALILLHGHNFVDLSRIISNLFLWGGGGQKEWLVFAMPQSSKAKVSPEEVGGR